MDQILDSHQVQNTTQEYAGFWLRFLAVVIDGFIMVIVQFIFMFILLGTASLSSMEGSPFEQFGFTYLFILAMRWLYFALMESSANQGTLGKMALGIKVTNLEGDRISFGQATARYFSKIISGMILLIGYFMMFWSEKSQCLHDKIADTLVVRK